MEDLIKELQDLEVLAEKLQNKLENFIKKTQIKVSSSKKGRNVKKSIEHQLKMTRQNIGRTKIAISSFKRQVLANRTAAKQEARITFGLESENDKKPEVNTPFDSYFRKSKEKGVGVSVWNVLNSIDIPEGKTIQYYVDLVISAITIRGSAGFCRWWNSHYFSEAYTYDDDTDNYITQNAEGLKALKELEAEAKLVKTSPREAELRALADEEF